MPKLKVLEREDAWNSSDAALMRVFLRDSLGQKVIRELAKRIPRVAGITMEQAAMNGKLHEGYQLCLDELAKLGADLSSMQDATNPTWAHNAPEK